MASVYAPVMYPPQPVLVFKHEPGDSPTHLLPPSCKLVTCAGGEAVLVGSGSVLGVDPGRVVVKRIVLSGHPFKINKRSAVIRHMFFNRGECLCEGVVWWCLLKHAEDILWFKPVELRTKFGRRGHIKETLGQLYLCSLLAAVLLQINHAGLYVPPTLSHAFP